MRILFKIIQEEKINSKDMGDKIDSVDENFKTLDKKILNVLDKNVDVSKSISKSLLFKGL